MSPVNKSSAPKDLARFLAIKNAIKIAKMFKDPFNTGANIA